MDKWYVAIIFRLYLWCLFSRTGNWLILHWDSSPFTTAAVRGCCKSWQIDIKHKVFVQKESLWYQERERALPKITSVPVLLQGRGRAITFRQKRRGERWLLPMPAEASSSFFVSFCVGWKRNICICLLFVLLCSWRIKSNCNRTTITYRRVGTMAL